MTVKTVLALVVVACMASADAKGLVGFKFEADHPDCLYRLGEEAVVTVTATNGAGETVRAGSVRVAWDNYGRRNLGIVKEWNFAEKNPLVVKGALDKPGFMRVSVQGKDSEGTLIGCKWGVGYEPEKIRPASERPADFDAFWEGAIAKFAKEVPIDAKMEKDEKESSKGKYDCYRLTFATVPQGRVIRGQLTVPQGKGPWPVSMNVPGAGSGSWGFSRTPGRVFLTLNVLDYPRVPQGMDDVKQLYADQNAAWGGKGGMGRTWYF